MAFDLLNVLAEAIPRDPTGTVAISTIALELCMITAVSLKQKNY